MLVTSEVRGVKSGRSKPDRILYVAEAASADSPLLGKKQKKCRSCTQYKVFVHDEEVRGQLPADVGPAPKTSIGTIEEWE